MNSVRHNVRDAGDDKFTRAFDTTFATHLGMLRQMVNGSPNVRGNSMSCLSVILRDVVNNDLQCSRCRQRPTHLHGY